MRIVQISIHEYIYNQIDGFLTDGISWKLNYVPVNQP